VELAIPKLRKGSFFPSILEPRRRIDQALYAVVMEAYVHGVSTRAVDELVAALGVGSGISRSEWSGPSRRPRRVGSHRAEVLLRSLFGQALPSRG
jgi:transposase-like protein